MRLLAVIGAAVVAAVVWFVIEVWRIARETDVTSAYEPTDEELDRLADNGIVGMPTWRPISQAAIDDGIGLWSDNLSAAFRARRLLD
jgi:hypothetical protein